MIATTDRWFTKMSPAFKEGVRLICIPNAGGGPAMFRTWTGELPERVGVFAALLPGQGSRLREIPPTETGVLAADLCAGIEPFLNEPYALFGYSMGALIAFEMTRLLRTQGKPLPVHLFVAARRAPQIPDAGSPLHALPEADFVNGVQSRYGGIPEVIRKDAELMTVFTPVLRANFTMIESYKYHEEEPLDIPLNAFGGTRDKTTNEKELSAWRQQSKRSFSYQLFDGDHFFIQQHQSAVLDTIKRSLKPFSA